MSKNCIKYVLAFILLINIVLISYIEANSIEDFKKELIVKFKIPIIQIPINLDKGGIELITMPENPTGKALLNSGISKIRRAHPLEYWKDSVVYNDFGIPVKRPNLSDIYIITFFEVRQRDAYYNTYNFNSDVEFMTNNEPDKALELIPNDTFFNRQWYLHNTGESGIEDSDIDAPEAWEIETGDYGTIIAVIDKGVWSLHPDLYPRVIGDQSYDDHGTHVAGIAAATGNNSEGIAGINWNAKILNKASDLGHSITTQQILDAVNEGAQVLNCSFGGYSYYGPMQSAAAYAYKMNSIVVAAKGNDASDQLHYPSDYEFVVGVSGTDQNDRFWSATSNYGNNVDVCAPAVGIISTTDWDNPLYGYYEFKEGTSMASPVVAGVYSLLHSYNNQLCNDDILNLIYISADDNVVDPAVPGYDQYTGWGRVNAYQALQLLQEPNHLSQWTASSGIVDYVTEIRQWVFIGTAGLSDGVHFAQQYKIIKNITFPREFVSTPLVWGRGVATLGFTGANPNYGAGYTEVIDGSVTTTGCVLKTFVYEVWELGNKSLGFFPCEPSQVQFAYTALGEHLLHSPDYISAGMHWDIHKQEVEVNFSDPNDTEDGYVIERKPATTGVWEIVDTLEPLEVPYFTYIDTTYVGSEMYSYRIKAFNESQPNPSYSEEVTFKTQPRWPSNYSAKVYYRVGSCVSQGEEINGVISKIVSGPGDSCGTNKAILNWQEPSNQSLPIDYYRILREKSYYEYNYYYTDTPGIVICPNETNTAYKFQIDAFDTDGDSSKVQSYGLLFGSSNVCPGLFVKSQDEGEHLETNSENLVTELLGNYPNPFNPTTNILFTLATPGNVKADIYNSLGQCVKNIHNGYLESGIHIFEWDSKNNSGETASSGIYFFKIQSDNYSASRKMLLLK